MAAHKQPFLKRGEGIARFGLKGAHVKFKKPLQRQQHQNGQLAHAPGKCLRSMSSPMLRSAAGILAGRDGSEVRE